MTSSLPTPSVVRTAQELHGRWGVSTIATADAAVLEYSCPLALQGHDCLVEGGALASPFAAERVLLLRRPLRRAVGPP